MNFSKSICWSSLGLSLLVTSVGCFKPTDSRTTKPTVQTRKTIGKTTQNVLELKAARQAGGVPASMAITSSGIGVSADAYRTSVGTMAVLAVEQKMQMHRAQFGKLSENYERFMDDIIGPGKPDGLHLPMLPYYQEYAYDPTSHKLVVIEFPNKKSHKCRGRDRRQRDGEINASLDTHSQPHVTDFDNVEIADIALLKERR